MRVDVFVVHPSSGPHNRTHRHNAARALRPGSARTPRGRARRLVHAGARARARPAAPPAPRRGRARSSTTRTTSCRRRRAADAPAVGSEDWLQDNHHVVQDQVREVRQDLPRQYYYELPKLADGPYAGYPRVYVIARELIVAHRGPLRSPDARRLRRRLPAGRAADHRRDLGDPDHAAPGARRGAAPARRGRRRRRAAARERARKWGAAAGEQRRRAPRRSSPRCCATSAATTGRLSAPFVVELLHWLRDQPSSAAPAWQALQRALEAQDDSPDEMLRARASARGRRPARDRQHHHQHAAAVVDRLAAVLRARQPGRADPARRSGGRLRADGLPDPRSLPPLGRAAGEGARGRRRRASRRAPSSWRARRSRQRRSTTARITSATT